jgi:hypothetical protein
VDAAFAVYATIEPNSELLAAQNVSYPQQSWLRIDAHNDGAEALHAECALQLLSDDGSADGASLALPPATIAAGSQALLANLSNSCPPGSGCLGVIECNASAVGDEQAVPLHTRHDLYPETLRHLHAPSSYSVSAITPSAGNSCFLSLIADKLSLLTYVASATMQTADHGNFVDNGFLLRPGVSQSLEFRPTNASEMVDCAELVASLLIYSANNPEAVQPSLRPTAAAAQLNELIAP